MSAPSTTLAQAATLVAARLMDSQNRVWTATELKVWVVRAHGMFVADTRCLWTANEYNDVANTGTMSVPSDLLKLTAVTWDYYPIPKVRMVDMVRREPNWRTKTGAVEAFMVDGDGAGIIRKIYTPAANATNKFGLEYYQAANALTGDSSILNILDWMVKYVVYYACFMALSREGEGQDLVLAAHYNLRYKKGVKMVKDMVSAVNAYLMTTVGSSSQTMPSFGYRLPPNYGRVEGRRR